MGPLSNPSPRSDVNAYGPSEPGRGPYDPPVMRPSDGSAVKDAIAKKLPRKR